MAANVDAGALASPGSVRGPTPLAVEGALRAAVGGLRPEPAERFQHERDVVPDVDALEHPTTEPVTVGDHRCAARTRRPVAPGELRGAVVLARATEVLGAVVLLGAQSMDHDDVRLPRELVRVIRLRQEHGEARRVDAAL